MSTNYFRALVDFHTRDILPEQIQRAAVESREWAAAFRKHTAAVESLTADDRRAPRGHAARSTASRRRPIHASTGTAMLLPIASYRGPSAAGLPR